MPVSKRGDSRGKQAQLFDRNVQDKWRQQILQNLGEGNGQVIDLLLSSDSKEQLDAVRKVSLLLTDTAAVIGCVETRLITCLVEMHSLCTPRHVLQRSIARCLECASEIHKDVIKQAIRDCLLKVMMSREEDGQRQCVDYIQSLIEHYRPGEQTLMRLSPHIIDCLVNYLETGYNELCSSNSQIHDLFVSTTKVLLNVLHHSSPAIVWSLPGTEINTTPHVTYDMEWPEFANLKGHAHWMRERLQAMVTICDQIMQNESYLPRDLILSVSMVYVVTMTTSHHLDLPSAVQDLFDEWLLSSHPNTSSGNGLLFSRLSICHALIAKLPHLHLASIVVNNSEVVLFALFPIICALLDHFTETSHRFNAAKTLAMWTALLRPCLDLPILSSRRMELSPDGTIVTTLLKYVWSLWEDPIEGIRHHCRSIFESLISFYQSGKDEQNHLLALSHPLLSLSSPTRGKYSLLASLVPHISVMHALREWPRLPNELMDTMGLQVLACRAGELWSRMVDKHYKESDRCVDVWKEVWFPPLVSRLLTGSPLAKQHVMQYCLTSLFTTAPNTMEIMSDVIKKQSHDLSCDNTDVLTAQLASMQCAVINGCGLPNDDHVAVLTRAIQHSDEQIVVSALQLLCESKRPTDLVPLTHLPLVHCCLITHMNSQSPSFRNQVISIFKKLLTRICDSSHHHLHSEIKKKRTRQRLQQTTAEEDDSSSSVIDENIRQYKDFLVLMSSYCLQTLHPLSNFQRRNLALSLLDVMSIVLDPSQLPVTVKERYNISALLPGPSVKGLVYVLYDSFDDNRILSLQLLDRLCEDHKGSLPPLRPLLVDYHRLITSPKSTDCAAGYRMTKFLVRHFPQDSAEILSAMTDTPRQDGEEGEEDWCVLVIRSLLSMLTDHVTKARQSLVSASIAAPMYGVIQSIRSVWEEINMSILSAQKLQQVGVVMNTTIDLCVSVGEMVSPVVCNSSPEGFMLPSSGTSENDGSLQLEEAHQISLCNHSNCCHGNSQSLLVCCWRSMKETIQLLSVIIDTAQENPNIVFVKEELIGDLFLQQLTKAYHRGAFEIAHVGFVKLCHYLWTRPGDPTHTCKPMGWVSELLGSLQSTSMAQLLSITRRSAGLPFYVQAILTTEPPSNGQKCLKHVMSTLLDIASFNSMSDQSEDLKIVKDPQDQFELVPEPSSVHALNILRGLYRDNKLGEHVTPYITEGLQIAIRGFSARYWPVRNSCTLLFSTLIMRVFGVKKVQDERSLENKLTSREFFSRFPSLHSFLLETLKESNQQLFPVLLLLSRLYPSPLDDMHSPVSMTHFRFPILKAAGSPIWKCRVLASDAFLPTLCSSDLADILSLLLKQLSIKEQNKSHGVLLMLSSILRHSSPTGVDGETLLTITKELLLVLFCKLISKSSFGTSFNSCHITRGSFIDLMCTLLPHVDSTQQATSVKQLIISARDDLLTGRLKGKPLANDLPSKLISFLVTAAGNVPTCFANELNVNSILVQSWQHYSELNVLTALVLGSVNDFSDGDKKCLAELALSKANKELTEGFEIVTGLLKIGHMFDATIVYLFENTVERLCKGFLREDLMIAMIRFLSTSLSVLSAVKEKSLVDLLSFMNSRCTETYPDAVRQSIASFLGNNWNVLAHLRPSLLLFWSMIFNLLQDVQEEVRREMCSSLGKMLSEISGRESKDSLCQQSTLKEIVFSIPKLYQAEPEQAVKILLHISNTYNDDHRMPDAQDRISALLFEEDKSNSYAEPLQLLEFVAQTLCNMAASVDLQSFIAGEVHGTSEFLNVAISGLFMNDEDGINLWQLKPNEIVDLFKKKYFKAIGSHT